MIDLILCNAFTSCAQVSEKQMSGCSSNASPIVPVFCHYIDVCALSYCKTNKS